MPAAYPQHSCAQCLPPPSQPDVPRATPPWCGCPACAFSARQCTPQSHWAGDLHRFEDLPQSRLGIRLRGHRGPCCRHRREHFDEAVLLPNKARPCPCRHLICYLTQTRFRIRPLRQETGHLRQPWRTPCSLAAPCRGVGRRVRYKIGPRPSKFAPSLFYQAVCLAPTVGWVHRRNEVASSVDSRQRRRQMVRVDGFRLCCGCLAGVQSS